MIIKNIEKNTDTKIEYHDVITSTNDRAKEIAQRHNINPDNLDYKIEIVIAEEQTNGRGTNNRVWCSNNSENILMTAIFYPFNSIKELENITYKIATMIKLAIFDLYNIKLDIKLPNDLLLDGKKICGILTESSINNNKINYLLIGVGFNVNQINFPPELSEIATSLKQKYAYLEFDREKIVEKIYNNLKSLFINL